MPDNSRVLIVVQQCDDSIEQYKARLSGFQFRYMPIWIIKHLQNGSGFSSLVNCDSCRSRCERNGPLECCQIGSSIVKSANLT